MKLNVFATKVDVMSEKHPVTMDYRSDRVRIFVDATGKVSCPPSVG